LTTARKNHYTHARGEFRKSARLSLSIVGIFEKYLKKVNNISKRGGSHLHHSSNLKKYEGEITNGYPQTISHIISGRKSGDTHL
jgi:hypothetical protein